MIGLIKDLSDLVKLELPTSFSKKRVIANFLLLYARSLPDNFGFNKDCPINNDNVKIDSDIWKSFNHIIKMYTKYIATKYLTMTYVIEKVATPWHSKSYIDFLRQSFTKDHINIIPSDITQKVEQISKSLTTHFEGIDYDIVNRWLLTYQYGLSKFHNNKSQLIEKLTNTHIIELGAGTGANIAVHAALSKKGASIFDIPPMLTVQQRIMEKISKDIEMSEISYYSDPQELIKSAKEKPYIIVSYWAFTEFPLELRKTLEPLIQNAEFSFFACNSVFEEINNLEYFSDLESRLNNKKVTSETIDWNPYKKHSYVMIKNNAA